MNDAEIQRRVKKALSLPFCDVTYPEMLSSLQEGKMQAFFNDDAFLVTEHKTTERRNYINYFLAAGEMDACWEVHDKQVLPFVKQHGITVGEGAFRPGWGPTLKKRGWKKVAEVWQEKYDHG